jgi:uncharacterized membrane protein
MRKMEGERTLGERLADGAADQIGSWRFLIIQTCCVTAWIILNVVAILKAWDPYPFVLLNLLFSVQAAYTGPVLLLSANRAAVRDRMLAEHDYSTNERAEELVEGILSEILRNSRRTCAIAEHLGVNLEGLEMESRLLKEKIDELESQLLEAEEVLSRSRHADQLDPSEASA